MSSSKTRQTQSLSAATSKKLTSSSASSKNQAGRNPFENEEENEEELEQMRREMKETQTESREATKRMLKMAQETNNTGTEIMVSLHDQQEQLDRIENKGKNVDENLKEANKQINNLQRLLKFDFFKKKKKKGTNEGQDQFEADQEGSQETKGNPVKKSSTDPELSKKSTQSGSSNAYKPVALREDKVEKEIDDDLDAIGTLLADMKAQAVTIGESINSQNQQIDRITEQTQRNLANAQNTNKKITKIM